MPFFFSKKKNTDLGFTLSSLFFLLFFFFIRSMRHFFFPLFFLHARRSFFFFSLSFFFSVFSGGIRACAAFLSQSFPMLAFHD